MTASKSRPPWSHGWLALALLGTLARGSLADHPSAGAAWLGNINLDDVDGEFMGLGGLSGGGGTSRLLYDYTDPVRGRILDALFSPKRGGALQILKVEIGGDGQSTEATEASHMHTRHDENYERGYEWWLMKEAKARNPDLKLYGLSWAVPGWIGNGSYFAGDDNINYHINWIEGAKRVHNLTIDYVGLPNVRIWNERDYDAGWLLRFRSALDLQGHHHVKIVVADTHWVCDDFVGNQTLLDAVGVFGAHYPITGRSHAAMPASCLTLGKPLWTSEGWSLREVNDYDGAMNLAMTVNYNWLDQRQTAFIVWTVVYAWYSILPFAHPVDGLVGGMGHGLVSATQPWSGHYRIQPTLYVLAHTTQFVRPGCRYIDATSTLSGGKFPTGSNGTDSVASAVAFRCPDDNTVTLVVETGDAKEAISASFELKSQNSTLPDVLHVWQTCNETYFERLPDSAIGQDGTLRVSLLPRCLYTFSSSSGQSGVPSAAIPAPSRFPKSYADTFDGYPDQGTVRYFTDQGGSFNAAPSPSGSGMVLEQVVDVRPIEWGHNPDPFTIAGDSQTWSDYSVFVDAMITSKSPLPPSPPPIVVHVVNRTSLQPCRPGSPLQQFSLDGLLLRSASSPGGCLGAGYVDAKWTGVRDAAVVTCNASDPWQQWTVRMGQRGGAHVELAAGAACSSTSCCLNVDGGKTTAGNGLLLWKCDTEADENWSFDESVLRYVGDASHGSYCVAVDGGPSPGPPGPPPSTQPSETSVKVCGRIGRYARGGSPPAGICLILDDRGMWYVVDGDGKSGSVREVEHVLATGRQPQGVDPEAGWVRVGLKFAGDSATAVVQGSPVATVGASHWPAGMIGLGSGWNKAMFDNLNITAGQP